MKRRLILFSSVFLIITILFTMNIYATDEIIEKTLDENSDHEQIIFPVPEKEEKDELEVGGYFNNNTEQLTKLSEENVLNIEDKIDYSNSDFIANNTDAPINVGAISSPKVVDFPTSLFYADVTINDKYMYFVSFWAGEIYRYDPEANSFTKIFTYSVSNVSNIKNYTWVGDVIYMLYENDSSSSQVIGYKISTNAVSHNVRYSFSGSEVDESFAMDSKGNLFINSSDNKYLISYNKSGNKISQFTYPSAYSAFTELCPKDVSLNGKLLRMYFKYGSNNVTAWMKLDGNGTITGTEFTGMHVGFSPAYYFSDYFVDAYGEICSLNYTDGTDTLAWTAYMTRSTRVSAYYGNNYLYTKSKLNALIKMNVNTLTIENSYAFDKNAVINFIKYNNGKVHVVYYLGGQYYEVTIDDSSIPEPISILYDSNTAMTHTKEQIISKYNNLSPKFNYSNSVYQEKPVAQGTYKAGSLKSQVCTDTLNQINLYRWLFGLNNTITLKNENNYRNQKGAVLLSATNEFSHYPSQPSDMPDDFYEDAIKGTGAGADWEGNIAAGLNLPKTIDGYVDDSNNVEPDVGHRNSILGLKATATSVGFCDVTPAQYKYSAVSMYLTDNDLGNNDDFYTWPPAGFCPVEMVKKASLWSITIGNDWEADLFNLEKIKIKFTTSTGKTATIDSNYIYIDMYSRVLHFDLPSNIKAELTGNSSNYLPGQKVSMEVSGIYDLMGNDYTLNYETDFFAENEILPTGAMVYINQSITVVGDQMTYTAKNGLTTYDLIIDLQPSNVTDGRIRVTFDDSSIASVNSDFTKITFKGLGTTTMHVYSVSTGEEVANVIITIDLPFVDVKDSDWFYNTVKYCYKEGLILGTDATHFSPYWNLSRGMIVTILWRMEGSPNSSTSNYKDVKQGDWYYMAINWATENDVVHGYVGGERAGCFGPNDPVTREQLCSMFTNFARYKKKDVSTSYDLSNFVDGNKVTPHFSNQVKWCVEKGIILGKDNGTRLDPKGNATRAEASAMIQRFCTKIK